MAETLEDILGEIYPDFVMYPLPKKKEWITNKKARIEAAMQREGWRQAVPFEKREKG